MRLLLLLGFCAAGAWSLRAQRQPSRAPAPVQAKAKGKGFGFGGGGDGVAVAPLLNNNKKKKSTTTEKNMHKVPPPDVLSEAALEALAALDAGPQSIRHFLNPKLFEDVATLEDVGQRLRSGELVVLRNAFRAEFAEAVHSDLAAAEAWTLTEGYETDGYHYKHHNIYDRARWSARLNATMAMFEDPETKAFAADISGRDTAGAVTGAPSLYGAGEHSLPHTDHFEQRSVAYIWHLSKRWRPEWGGALYWAPHQYASAYCAASFNSLVLFSVTTKSAHFVTTVSPHATERRLALNGWWNSAWVPTAEDGDRLEECLATPEARQRLTFAQIEAIQAILDDPWTQNLPPDRAATVAVLRAKLLEEAYPVQDPNVVL